jgi:hypothetical protein
VGFNKETRMTTTLMLSLEEERFRRGDTMARQVPRYRSAIDSRTRR